MTPRPEFHVHRLAHTDCDGVMEIVPISEVELGTTMPRRSMFRAGLTVAGAVAALAACNDTTPRAPETTVPAPPPPASPVLPPLPTLPPIEEPPPLVAPVPVPPSRPRPSRLQPLPQPGGARSGTQACGTPLPPGAICTCNCVPVRPGTR